MDELLRIVNRWRQRERLRLGLVFGGRGLVLGLLLTLIVLVVVVPRHLLLQSEFILLALGVSLGSLAVGILAAAFKPMPPLTAARSFDRQLGLNERVSTALELAQSLQLRALTPLALIEHQMQDALMTARQVDISAKMPLRLPKREVSAAGLLLVVLLLLGWRSQAQFTASQAARNLQQAIQTETEKLEALEQALTQDSTLTPEQRQELTQALQQAIQQMEQTDTLEGAVSALQEAQQALQPLVQGPDPQAIQSLQTVGTQWSQSGDKTLQSLGEALASGDLHAAAQALAQAEIVESTAEQAEQQAQELESAAQALASTNPALAEKLQSAAQALRSGNASAAQGELRSAGQQLSQMAQQQALASAASQAAAQTANSQAQLAQAAGSPQIGMTPSQGAGQGSSQTAQQGQGGSGAGRGEGSGETTSGQPAGSNPMNPNNGPGDGGERPLDTVYTPQNLGGEGGQNVPLPQSGAPGDTSLGTAGSSPGAPEGSQVPYTEVFSNYAEAYRQAISSGQTPPHLREYIRLYFSALEP